MRLKPLIDGSDIAVGPQPLQLGAFLQGRTLGLIAVDRPGADDLRRRAGTLTRVSQTSWGLGSVTLVARRHADADDPELWGEAKVTLLLVGPVGDDHGRVKGALRELGARFGQAETMIKMHDGGAITTFRLDAPKRPSVAEACADAFDPTQLGTYCAALREMPIDPDLVPEAWTGRSFFTRRATARSIA